MVGETNDNWRECVRKTIELDPDSVTIYQMEVPYNTTIFKEMKVMGQSVAPVAAWKTKRDWVSYAFAELEKAGYTVRSAYTAVKNPAKTRFVYTDLLWSGADMIGLGVAFSPRRALTSRMSMNSRLTPISYARASSLSIAR